MTTDGVAGREDVARLLRLIVRETHRLPDLSVGEQDLALRLARRARLLGRLAESLREHDLLESLPKGS